MTHPPAVFVAMVDDRHRDPEPYVFDTAPEAVGFAERYAADNASDGFTVEVEPVDGWLYCARFTIEGDSVWVLERRIGDTARPT